NSGYKRMDPFGGFDEVGPILQGLQKPVNDLSRGSDEDDLYKLALITELQAASHAYISSNDKLCSKRGPILFSPSHVPGAISVLSASLCYERIALFRFTIWSKRL